MPTEFDLVALADAYASATGVALSTVSARVFDDGKRISQIRAGRGITLSRFNRALTWFSANWPDGAEWPAHIKRPIVENEAAE